VRDVRTRIIVERDDARSCTPTIADGIG